MRKLLLALLIVAPSIFQANNLRDDAVMTVRINNRQAFDKIEAIYQERRDSALYEAVIEVIKKYETIHGPEHYPYIAYGHMLLPEDSLLTLPVTEQQADSILRVDLNKKMSYFEGDFKTRLLLGTLSYNVGQYRLICPKDGSPSSNVARLLMGGKKDLAKIKKEYTSWRKWNGKVIKSIERRRVEEFDLIFPQA